VSSALALAVLAGLAGGAAVVMLLGELARRRLRGAKALAWLRLGEVRSGARASRRVRPADAHGGRPPVHTRAAWLVAGGLAALVLAPAAPGRSGVLLLVAGPVAGFFAPEALLRRARRRRLEAAVRDLPDMLDLLRVTVTAGLAPDRALAAVGAEFTGPLAREWRRVAAEVALGVAPERAFRGLSERLPADEIVAFVDALERSRRHGVPLARGLATQSARTRHARAQRVREHAARAGPKIQLVVALVLVPSVLLIVTAGVLSELEQSGLAELR
jgi:tight adherence protein C